jgi:hypothetical protein
MIGYNLINWLASQRGFPWTGIGYKVILPETPMQETVAITVSAGFPANKFYKLKSLSGNPDAERTSIILKSGSPFIRSSFMRRGYTESL